MHLCTYILIRNINLANMVFSGFLPHFQGDRKLGILTHKPLCFLVESIASDIKDKKHSEQYTVILSTVNFLKLY